MGEREAGLSGGGGEGGSSFGWSGLVVLVGIGVWVGFGPVGPVWLYFLGCAGVAAAADGVVRLALRRGWVGGMASPGRLLAKALRLGPESWLLAPRWAKARLVIGGFLVFGTVAGGMGWEAGREYQVLRGLRERGIRTGATVVEIASRSEEGRATSLAVRFGTSSGPVRADVDVSESSSSDERPGARIPVVYDPVDPSEVPHVDHLDGHQASGIRTGSVVIGLLAAGFLVGSVREVVLTRRQG